VSAHAFDLEEDERSTAPHSALAFGVVAIVKIYLRIGRVVYSALGARGGYLLPLGVVGELGQSSTFMSEVSEALVTMYAALSLVMLILAVRWRQRALMHRKLLLGTFKQSLDVVAHDIKVLKKQANVNNNNKKTSEKLDPSSSCSRSIEAAPLLETSQKDPDHTHDSTSPNKLDVKPSSRFQIIPSIHIEILPGLDEPAGQQMIEKLRLLVLLEHDDYEGWLNDHCLWRFLVARKFDVMAAKKQLISALHWRKHRRPDLIRAVHIANEACTGKVCVRGKDRYGRPVLVLDSSKENTFEQEGNMRLLAYQLERAIRLMESNVDKYVIVVRLGETSMFNFSKLPGPSQTKETLKMLMTVFAERLGHGILYQPPRIFTLFLNLFASLMDAHVMSKAVWIAGDVSENSSNDKAMRSLIGDHWREIVGEGQTIYDPKMPPGYNHAKEWAQTLKDEEGLSVIE